MKKLLLALSLPILSMIGSMGQANFGLDVIIQNAPATDQRNAVITTAFNGWLYAAYTTVDSAANSGGVTIRKSIDKGINWQTVDFYSAVGIRYEDVEIEVAGTDTNNLTLFVFGINHSLGSSNYLAYLDKYNGTTNGFMGSSFYYPTGTNKIYDLDIATDYTFPAVGSSPYSVGLLLSKYGSTYDSIIFYSSIDGGASFANAQGIASTGAYFGKVSLSYGRSASGSNGRYFAAWERKISSGARNANIYTSRCQSTVDGPWIAPVNLDSVSSTMIGLCRNPRISVQANALDNDSGSCSAVVLVDRDYNGDASDYDLLGFYNKRSHYTNFWYRLDILNSGENDMQPDISFNNTDTSFVATYFDSTNFQLRYVKNNSNLSSPSTWTVVTTSYNDIAPGTNPFPRISHNPVENGIASVWTRRGLGNNGVALFDAEYTVIFAGVDENNEPTLEISAYPNPVSEYLYINLEGIENARLQLLNGNGQLISTYNIVSNHQMISMTELANGIYFLRFDHQGKTITKKIIKN